MKYKCIDLMYPNCGAVDSIDGYEIELVHVRAADEIRVHYDFDRDGWVISQEVCIIEDQEVMFSTWVEVGFHKAWKFRFDVSEDKEIEFNIDNKPVEAGNKIYKEFPLDFKIMGEEDS